MMMIDLWGTESYSVVGVDRYFGAMMEAVLTSFETSVNLNETTRVWITESCHLYKRRRENLKSPKLR
jgi:hypothetical protein